MSAFLDVAPTAGAPETEIEVTAAMIAAGENTLLMVADSDVRVGLVTSGDLAAVYRAMRRLEPATEK